MKAKKRILSVLLAVCMLLALMPTAAFAEDTTDTGESTTVETSTATVDNAGVDDGAVLTEKGAESSGETEGVNVSDIESAPANSENESSDTGSNAVTFDAAADTLSAEEASAANGTTETEATAVDTTHVTIKANNSDTIVLESYNTSEETVNNDYFQGIINNLAESGAENVTINIPEGVTLYLRYHNNKETYIPKSITSLTITGSGTLEVTNLGNKPLYLNGVKTVIEGITLNDSIVAGTYDGTHIEKTDVTLENVKQNGNMSVYGGSGAGIIGWEWIDSANKAIMADKAGNVETTRVVINKNTALYGVYGGNNGSGTVTKSYVEVNGGSIQYLCGGGTSSKTDSSTTTNGEAVLNGGTVTYATGGGHSAYTKNAKLIINNGATVSNNAFGGGIHTATADNTEVIMNGGNLTGGDIYGGAQSGTVTGKTSVVINGGTASENVYGGGYTGRVEGDTSVTIDGGTVFGTVYGGGRGRGAAVDGDVTGTASVTVSTGTVHDIYGGGRAQGKGEGTGEDACASCKVANAVITLAGGDIQGTVTAGGANDTTAKVTSSTVNILSADFDVTKLQSVNAATVKIPATSVSLAQDAISLTNGSEATMKANIIPSVTTDKISWSSDSDKVAAVDGNGKIAALSEGTAVITVTVGDFSAVCKVTVTHSYSDEWKSDAGSHWHECTCGDKTNVANHTYGDWAVKTAATETAKGEKYRTCTVCGYTETAEIPTFTVIDSSVNQNERIVQTALTEVPDGLMGTNFNTVAAIKKELTRVAVANAGYTEANTVVNDVKLQIYTDGKWKDATEYDILERGGITVILPYPEGTGKNTHDFVVTHMFTVTSETLGTTAGKTETPTVKKLDNGIQVTLTGLSPVSISWKAVSASTDKPDSSTTSPQTGDSSNLVLWFVLLGVSAAGLGGVLISRKRRSNRA